MLSKRIVLACSVVALLMAPMAHAQPVSPARKLGGVTRVFRGTAGVAMIAAGMIGGIAGGLITLDLPVGGPLLGVPIVLASIATTRYGLRLAAEGFGGVELSHPKGINVNRNSSTRRSESPDPRSLSGAGSGTAR